MFFVSIVFWWLLGQQQVQNGTFDIPSPPKKDGRNVNISDRLDKVEVKESSSSSTFVPPPISPSQDILDKISPGEYEVYFNKSTKQHYIVIHLFSSDKPEVKAYETYITVSNSDETFLKIDISKFEVDVKTTHVQQWNDFLTIRFSK